MRSTRSCRSAMGPVTVATVPRVLAADCERGPLEPPQAVMPARASTAPAPITVERVIHLSRGQPSRYRERSNSSATVCMCVSSSASSSRVPGASRAAGLVTIAKVLKSAGVKDAVLSPAG
jgi:hypothetical protein